jgi:hypothetical protein
MMPLTKMRCVGGFFGAPDITAQPAAHLKFVSRNFGDCYRATSRLGTIPATVTQ